MRLLLSKVEHVITNVDLVCGAHVLSSIRAKRLCHRSGSSLRRPHLPLSQDYRREQEEPAWLSAIGIDIGATPVTMTVLEKIVLSLPSSIPHLSSFCFFTVFS